MSKVEQAMQVLMGGGYFRKQLETQYRGGEKFETRLRDVNGHIVRGIGPATFYKLESQLSTRECARSTVWPTEYVLRAAHQVAA